MPLVPKNQCLECLGICRARSMRTPPQCAKAWHLSLPASCSFNCGDHGAVTLLWRRPVTKSPGPSGPPLGRYRARRMDLCRLGSFHRGFPDHEAPLGASPYIMAPEICRLTDAWIGAHYCSAGTCLFIRYDFSHESQPFSFHRNQNSLNHGDRLDVTLISRRPA